MILQCLSLVACLACLALSRISSVSRISGIVLYLGTCTWIFRSVAPEGGVTPVGGKGYKEQERGQKALVSLWCMLGIAWRASFALRLAHARMVAG